MHKAPILPTGFRATFAALLSLNYWSAECFLSADINHFELRCRSKQLTLLCFKYVTFLLRKHGRPGSSRDEK